MPGFDDWLTRQQGQTPQHGHVPPGDPFAPGFIPARQDEPENKHEVRGSNYGIHPHKKRRKWWVTIIRAAFALLVVNAIAMLVALLHLFPPTNGIPALVEILFGIVAIGCLFCILFIDALWRMWLVAFGVGFGFYIIWFLYFWG